MNAARFVVGFITALLGHAIRISVWAGLVMLAAGIFGMPPVQALVLVVAANLAGCLLYRL